MKLRLHTTRRAATAVLAAALFARAARAQITHEAWVNPQSGNDGTGLVDNPSFPFLTLQAAISQTSSVILSDPGKEGLVHAMPGLYSDDPSIGNGESFPIAMASGVHVQGFGAKECVLRMTCDITCADTSRVFLPVCDIGYVDDVFVLVDMTTGDEFETSIENFTFQGGDVQVSVYGEASSSGRISNCIFDMTYENPALGRKPHFGVLMTSLWDAATQEYPALSYNIFNNTFVQGWTPGGNCGDLTADLDAVAICNANDTAGDVDDEQHGPNDLNIQNNLIRQLPSAPRTAFLGIDAGDTSVAFGTTLGNTNAFDPGAVGPTSANGLYCSESSSDPVPKVNVNGGANAIDPGFVGEWLSQTQAGFLTNDCVRDSRLLPDSLLVDQGSTPAIFGGTQIRVLTAVSGLSYAEPPNWKIASFDWDGDGHGNLRTVGEETDIGFDETDRMLIAGNYGNESKSHNTPFHPSVVAGNPVRYYLFKVTTGIASTSYTMSNLVTGTGWTIPPGTTAGTNLGAAGILYLTSGSIVNATLGSIVSTTWHNPLDPVGTDHTFGRLKANDSGDQGPPTPLPRYLNQQVRISGDARYTNLACEIY